MRKVLIMCDQSNQEQNVSNDSGVNDVLKIFDAYFETPNNLFALLYRYKVRVPGIQRHYVQGADTAKAKEVRENFIKQLLSGEPTHLHFVYGPIDTTGEDAFTPVDGQQRLTTLWLLARYVIEYLPEEQKTYRNKYLSLLSRFSYADRIHSTRFCQALTDPENHWDIDKDPFESVPHQPWFWDYWKEDETVSSMLRMLSTIHKQSQEMKKDSSFDSMNLLKHIATGITFSLQIDSYADDIYMKMNARGLQLTQWENFKGKFAELLVSEALRKDWEEKVEKLSDKYFTKTNDLPDTAFFSLFCRLLYFKMRTTGQSEKKKMMLRAFPKSRNTQIKLMTRKNGGLTICHMSRLMKFVLHSRI